MRIAFIPLLSFLFIFASCTDTRIRRYSDILQPHIGSAHPNEMATILGDPAFCRPERNQQLCEYRTTAGRNEQTPYTHRKAPGFGPDLSPYEHFDVVHLYYDDFGVLRDWQPIVLPHPQ